MVKTRVITALIMLAVVLGTVFLASPQVWLVAVSALMAWAAIEWANLAGFSKVPKALYAFIVPTLLGVGYVGRMYEPMVITIWLLATVAFWLLVVPMWLYFGWKVTSKPFMALIGILILVAAGWCLLLVRPSKEYGWVLLAFLMVVWVADSVAFFTGRAFGKNKLAPAISPGKTIEGALGAWLGVVAYLMLLVYGTEYFGLSLSIHLSIPKMLLLAFIMTYISILGDLFESWLKRCAGIKDSGNALPGHGGILDRIDAILSTLPVQVVAFQLLMVSGG